MKARVNAFSRVRRKFSLIGTHRGLYVREKNVRRVGIVFERKIIKMAGRIFAIGNSNGNGINRSIVTFNFNV